MVLSTFCCSSSPPIPKRRELWARAFRVSSDVCCTGEFHSEELVWDDGSSSRTGTQLALFTQLPIVVVFFVGILLLVRELLIWLKTSGAIERKEDDSNPYGYLGYPTNSRQDSTYRAKRDSDYLLIRVLNRWVARVHVLRVLLASLECWRTELWESLWGFRATGAKVSLPLVGNPRPAAAHPVNKPRRRVASRLPRLRSHCALNATVYTWSTMSHCPVVGPTSFREIAWFKPHRKTLVRQTENDYIFSHIRKVPPDRWTNWNNT